MKQFNTGGYAHTVSYAGLPLGSIPSDFGLFRDDTPTDVWSSAFEQDMAALSGALPGEL